MGNNITQLKKNFYRFIVSEQVTTAKKSISDSLTNRITHYYTDLLTNNSTYCEIKTTIRIEV